MNQISKNYYSLLPIKKGVLLLALSLLLTCIPGCGTTTHGGTELNIGVAIYQQNDTFISTIVQNMEGIARQMEEEHDLLINLSIADGRSNQTVQLDQIDQFIQQDCDVICVNSVDRTAASVIIDKAESANIPIILFNREPVEEDMRRWDSVYYVGAQAAQSGQLQGEIVRDLWLNHLDWVDSSGDGIMQYVMLEGEPSHQDTLLRTQYAITTLTDAHITVKKLKSGSANWTRGEATVKMNQWLEEFGNTIEVVFANNDDMALGAIDAYLAQGYAPENLPVIVGVDAIPQAVEAVKNGTLTGTVLNDSDGIAQGMMDLSLCLWREENPLESFILDDGHYLWLPYQMVTRDTLENQSEF